MASQQREEASANEHTPLVVCIGGGCEKGDDDEKGVEQQAVVTFPPQIEAEGIGERGALRLGAAAAATAAGVLVVVLCVILSVVVSSSSSSSSRLAGLGSLNTIGRRWSAHDNTTTRAAAVVVAATPQKSKNKSILGKYVVKSDRDVDFWDDFDYSEGGARGQMAASIKRPSEPPSPPDVPPPPDRVNLCPRVRTRGGEGKRHLHLLFLSLILKKMFFASRHTTTKGRGCGGGGAAVSRVLKNVLKYTYARVVSPQKLWHCLVHDTK